MLIRRMPWLAIWTLLISLPVHSTEPMPGCIITYQHANYNGAQLMLCLNGEKKVIVPRENLFEDSITSIKLSSNVIARACQHPDGTGVCRTYFRSVPNVWEAMNDKISTITLTAFNPDDFTMLFSGGPNYPKACHSEGLKECFDFQVTYDKETALNKGRIFSRALKEIIGYSNGSKPSYHHETPEDFTSHGSPASHLIGASTVAGLVFTGPMTLKGNINQMWHASKAYYSRLINVYPGLGQSDYQPLNNGYGCENSICIKDVMDYMRTYIRSLNPLNFDFNESSVYYRFPTFRKDHSGSLAYSWEVGNVHFIQLHDSLNTSEHYYQSWDFGKMNTFTIRNAKEWLKNDLEAAYSSDKKIVLLLRYWDHNDRFLEDLVRKYKINAIFAHKKSQDDAGYQNVHGPNTFLRPTVLGRTIRLVRFKGKDVYVASLYRQYSRQVFLIQELQSEGFSY
ncbi:MAG: hypothetical protein ACR2PT_10510 [Endozoicomonas sp.]